MTSSRDYKYDNIRFILIVLVIVGHLLEISTGIAYRDTLYKFIYSFHMAAFLFLSGRFAHYNKKKIILKMLLPYFYMQTGYILFSRWLYSPDMVLQYTTPYWLLWYLLALVVYNLLIPLYDLESPLKCLCIWIVSIILAIVVGYDGSVSDHLSLSRIIVFQPWFILGYYCKRHKETLQEIKLFLSKNKYIWNIVLYLSVILAIILLQNKQIVPAVLYCSAPYQAVGYGFMPRLICMFISFVFILFLFGFLGNKLNKRIPVISTIGQNTLGIYLLHGYIVRYLMFKFPDLISNTVYLILVLVGILFVLGNPLVSHITNFVLANGWFSSMEKRFKK